MRQRTLISAALEHRRAFQGNSAEDSEVGNTKVGFIQNASAQHHPTRGEPLTLGGRTDFLDDEFRLGISNIFGEGSSTTGTRTAGLNVPNTPRIIPHDCQDVENISQAKQTTVDAAAKKLELGKLLRPPYFTGYPKEVSRIDLHGNGKWVFEYERGSATYAPATNLLPERLQMTARGEQYAHLHIPNHFHSIPISEGFMKWLQQQDGKVNIRNCQPADLFRRSYHYDVVVTHPNDKTSQYWVDESGKVLSRAQP